jgi:predicted permease
VFGGSNPAGAGSAARDHRQLPGEIDMRQVLRNLARRPGFTFVTVLTLALGIGANSVIFGVVDSVLLQPLPFPEAGDLVRVHHSAPGLDIVADIGLSDATYFYLRSAEVLQDLALYEQAEVNLSGGESPERVVVAHVSHGFFSVLGISPLAGRTFREEEERPGAAPVVIIGEGLWRQRFAGNPTAVGESVVIDGVAHEVVAIAPAGLAFPDRNTQLWLPRRLDPASTNIGHLGIDAIGRKRPELSAAETGARLAALLQNLEELFPIEQGSGVLARAGFTTHAVPLRDTVLGDLAQRLWVLMGSVAFVLAIACANVANLFLVRAEEREREMALRTALGASRRHIVAGFLQESVALGVLAGGLGLLLAWLGLEGLVRFGPQSLPRIEEIGTGGRVFGFTVLLSLAAGLVLGMIPALRYGSAWLASALREGGRAVTMGRQGQRTRSLLVVSQVALALVLLVGSGLMVRSFRSLSRVDPGFEAGGVLTFRLSLPPAEYPGEDAPAAFVQRAIDELAGLPGVLSAGAVTGLPLSGRMDGSGVSIEDHPEGPDELPRVHFDQLAAPGYFETLRIPLVEGRTFEPADHQQRRGNVVVNEAFARRYWPGGSALGKRLQPREGDPDAANWYTIVGVMGSVHYMRLEEEPRELIYYPMVSLPGDRDHFEARTMSFVLRTDREPGALAAAVRQRIVALDPDLPIAELEAADRLLARARSRTAFTMTLLLAGAAGALLIGAVGIYGVISCLVSRRIPEIGIRMALGASAGAVVWAVLQRSLAATVLGILIGVGGAIALTRVMGALLFGVSPLDPLTFGAVILVLAAVTAAAAYVPARRATKVSPLQALRSA